MVGIVYRWFICQAIKSATRAIGLVLINTLRKPGLRLDWINESTLRAFATGGRELLLVMAHVDKPRQAGGNA